LSGPGLVNIYNFLKDTNRGVEPDGIREEIEERIRTGDPAGVISDFALLREAPLCSSALDLFVNLYGAESGNLALRALAFGGIYLGGGIAPKIADRLAEGKFMDAFLAKDRMAAMLANIPVYIILEERTALLGAARYAASHASSRSR
jgi:glucokinase